jgi:hypothetical protein
VNCDAICWNFLIVDFLGRFYCAGRESKLRFQDRAILTGPAWVSSSRPPISSPLSLITKNVTWLRIRAQVYMTSCTTSYRVRISELLT